LEEEDSFVNGMLGVTIFAVDLNEMSSIDVLSHVINKTVKASNLKDGMVLETLKPDVALHVGSTRNPEVKYTSCVCTITFG